MLDPIWVESLDLDRYPNAKFLEFVAVAVCSIWIFELRLQ